MTDKVLSVEEARDDVLANMSLLAKNGLVAALISAVRREERERAVERKNSMGSWTEAFEAEVERSNFFRKKLLEIQEELNKILLFCSPEERRKLEVQALSNIAEILGEAGI